MAYSSAFGTILEMGDGAVSPAVEAFVAIARLGDISGPGITLETNEVTRHDSPGAFKEKVAGLLEAGEVSAELDFDLKEATQDATTGLVSKQLARQMTNFRIRWPNDTWVKFPALVTEFEPDAPVEDPLTADITLEVVGAPTFGDGEIA